MPTYTCGAGCSITCPNGGGCARWDDGSCDRFCNGDTIAPTRVGLSGEAVLDHFEVHDMTLAQVMESLSVVFSQVDDLPTIEHRSPGKKLSFSVERVSVRELAFKLAEM